MSLSPFPKLSIGGGKSKSTPQTTHAAPGSATQIYQPVNGMDYAPRLRENRFSQFPAGIGGADDGANLIGYHTHAPGKVYQAPQQDFQSRADREWQQYAYPPQRRILFTAQVAQKYQIGNSTVLTRPADSSNYFIGFMPNAAAYGSGQSPLGS